MNEEQKLKIQERYYQAKQKGVKFFPDIIYKDLVVMFALFILLIGLATFVGVPKEPKADPSDTSYIPRPEWYFLFLFQLLKYFPGELEWLGASVLPALVVILLFALPFIDRNPHRYWKKRKLAISTMSFIVTGMVALTIIAAVTTPPQEERGTLASTISEQILAGADLFGVHCVECHGSDGEGGEIKGVEGLEGVIVKPINSQDEMYTRSDETFYNIIAFGQPSLGMPPFSRAYGGELGPGDIEAIVTFMRYTWDDRAELPAEVAEASAIPTLGPNEIPSFEVHIFPILKRYCLSCHRPGKKNNNYLMRDYNETMNSGDHAPNIILGDLNSNLILMLYRQEIEAGGPMPPTKALKPELIEIFERWVLGGAPNTAADAAALSPTATATPPPQGTTTESTETTTPQVETTSTPQPQ